MTNLTDTIRATKAEHATSVFMELLDSTAQKIVDEQYVSVPDIVVTFHENGTISASEDGAEEKKPLDGFSVYRASDMRILRKTVKTCFSDAAKIVFPWGSIVLMKAFGFPWKERKGYIRYY